MSCSKRTRLAFHGLEAILSPELTDNHVATVPAVVATARDKKCISKALCILQERHPLPAVQGCLKRVKFEDGQASLIVKLGNASGEALSADLCDLLDKDTLRVVSVPASVPLTRAQKQRADVHWPCKFFEDKRLEALIGQKLPELWGSASLNSHFEHMQLAVNCGACIVDPDSGSVVCTTSSDRRERNSRHPLSHTVFCLLEGLSEISSREQYLATGLDVYLAREPCITCAMALTHSRVKRLFYHSRSSDGCCESLVRMHTIKDLNHAMQVYRID